MTQVIITKYSDFDPTIIGLDVEKCSPMQNTGLYEIPLTYKGSKLFIETPAMLCPHGVSLSSSPTLNMDVDVITDGAERIFHRSMKLLEYTIKYKAYMIREKLGFNGLSDSNIFTKMIPILVDGHFIHSDRFTPDFVMKYGNIICNATDKNNQPIDVKKIAPGSYCKLLLSIESLYFVKSQHFGVTVNIQALKVIKENTENTENTEKKKMKELEAKQEYKGVCGHTIDGLKKDLKLDNLPYVKSIYNLCDTVSHKLKGWNYTFDRVSQQLRNYRSNNLKYYSSSDQEKDYIGYIDKQVLIYCALSNIVWLLLIGKYFRMFKYDKVHCNYCIDPQYDDTCIEYHDSYYSAARTDILVGILISIPFSVLLYFIAPYAKRSFKVAMFGLFTVMFIYYYPYILQYL